jgi:hypothetical protein
MSKNVLHRIGQPISYSQYFTSHVSAQDYTVPACRVHTALSHDGGNANALLLSISGYLGV